MFRRSTRTPRSVACRLSFYPTTVTLCSYVYRPVHVFLLQRVLNATARNCAGPAEHTQVSGKNEVAILATDRQSNIRFRLCRHTRREQRNKSGIPVSRPLHRFHQCLVIDDFALRRQPSSTSRAPGQFFFVERNTILHNLIAKINNLVYFYRTPPC